MRDDSILSSSAERLVIPGVLVRDEPAAGAVPLVVDSPHSGRDYPADFRFAAAFDLLRRAEDAFVDELFATAPSFGATLIAALFPRSYIDPNRHEEDLDTSLLDGPWPYTARPSDRSARGLGLVRRLVRSNVEVYDRRLSAEEVKHRIDRCHRPYHAELQTTLDRLHARFGAVWHLNCHSMRSHGRYKGRDGPRRADFVLGDLEGRSCSAELTELVATTLRSLGHTVALNQPFKGAEIVGRHGRPADNRHSLQIEVNRGLYMDEARIEKASGFAVLRRDLAHLLETLAAFAKERSP